MATRRRGGNGNQREAGATGARLDDIFRRIGSVETRLEALSAEVDGRMLRLEKRVVWFAGAGAGIGGFIALALTILGALAAWR